MDKLLYLTHPKIDVTFTKNSKDFIVEEVPLYDFRGEGEHLILKIRKKEMTTWSAIQKISEIIGVKLREIGYAGLKDRDGFTIQYISIPKKYEKELKNFENDKIKILETTYHKNKIKIGHLKGNRFFIRLKKVLPTQADILKSLLEKIESNGIPNYFGYQRFGRDKENFIIGKELLEGKRRERSRKRRDFFISAYQSHLFNLWLSKRVEISKLFEAFSIKELEKLFNYPKEIIKEIKSQKQFCKILPGDIMHHYPYGKVFISNNIIEESERFYRKEITLTGFLFGKRAIKSDGIARELEKDIFDEVKPFEERVNGNRRFAWIFPKEIKSNYREKEAWFEFNFYLPKGSYATTLLEELIE